MNIATIIDVIDAYPKPCRLAFYLTFEIVIINLANVRSDHLRRCEKLFNTTEVTRVRKWQQYI